MQGHMTKLQRARLGQYLAMANHSPSEAEALLSTWIRPKATAKIVLRDTEGRVLGTSQVMEALLDNMLKRGVDASEVDTEHARMVRDEVKAARAAARAETVLENGDPFSFEQVGIAIALGKKRRSTVGFEPATTRP